MAHFYVRRTVRLIALYFPIAKTGPAHLINQTHLPGVVARGFAAS
jgi:hypothetical protein